MEIKNCKESFFLHRPTKCALEKNIKEFKRRLG